MCKVRSLVIHDILTPCQAEEVIFNNLIGPPHFSHVLAQPWSPSPTKTLFISVAEGTKLRIYT